MDKSIFATATITNKSENQDGTGKKSTDLLNSVFVTDGLGTYKYARKASVSVIETLQEEINNIENISCLSLEKIFRKAKDGLINLSEKEKTEEDKSVENLFETTAIALVETEKTIKTGYVGNGAIFHIRGNFNEFPAAYPFPWNAVNLLNPHSVSENGKEALCRLISDYPKDYNESIPTVLEIEKDNQQGDIFMICTDGIYSEDQRYFGTNNKGIWVKYEKTMQKFFEHLKQFFEENSEYTNEILDTALNLYLQEVKPELDDDASLGVLITGKTIEYQKNKQQQNVNENDTDNQVQEQSS